MAEAMDAADMPGLHSKLRKLHRNLGDGFQHLFHLFDLLTLFAAPHKLERRGSAYIDDDPTG